MRAAPFRRGDVVALTVRYADGTVDDITDDECRVGTAVVWTARDAPGKDAQEWDTMEVTISGPKRKPTSG